MNSIQKGNFSLTFIYPVCLIFSRAMQEEWPSSTADYYHHFVLQYWRISMKLKVLLGALGLAYNHMVSNIGTICSPDRRPCFDCPLCFIFLIILVNHANCFRANARTHVRQSFFYAHGTCLQSVVSLDERSDCALRISAQHQIYYDGQNHVAYVGSICHICFLMPEDRTP